MRWSVGIIFCVNLLGAAEAPPDGAKPSAIRSDAETVELPRAEQHPANSVIRSSFTSPQLEARDMPAENFGKSGVIAYEFRRPGAATGQAAGFRVLVTDEFRLQVFALFALNQSKRSDWTQMLDEPIDKAAAQKFVQWMARRKLDLFDARAVSEKCAELRPVQFRDNSPSETLSLKFANCPDRTIVFWRDLPTDAAAYHSIPELQALNLACDEIVKFASAVCAEKSVLKDILKRE